MSVNQTKISLIAIALMLLLHCSNALMTLETVKKSPGGHLLRLSPLTAYYIRKLLYQHAGELKFVVAEGAGKQANYLADLNAVLESLYLEESEIEAAVKRLEILVYYHQTFSAYTALHKTEVNKAEKEIFWVLGFKQRTSTNAQ